MSKKTFLISKEIEISDLPVDMKKDICSDIIKGSRIAISSNLLGVVIYPNPLGEFYDDYIEKTVSFDEIFSEIEDITDDIGTLSTLRDLLLGYVSKIDSIVKNQ